MNDLSRKLILAIPYPIFGLAATKLSQAVRLSPEPWLLHLSEGLDLALQSWAPSFHPTDLLVGLAVGAGLWLAAYVKRRNAKKFRKGEEHGSARWGTRADIKPFIDPDFQNNVILSKTERLTMNDRPKPVKLARNKNVLVYGGSGSGKTRFFLKPNLMQCTSEKYPTSFVVTDPKGSVIVECGELLRRRGYRIKFFNTINFSKSMHYNPFAYIHSEKDILKLVNVLIANTTDKTKTGGDEFWTKAERMLYTALIAYLYYEAPKEEQNFGTLIDLLDSMQVHEDDEEATDPVDILFQELAKKKPRHFAVRQYKKYKQAAGATAKSILISCASRLAPFDIQEVRDITAYDELELDTLGDKKTALFLMMSDTDDTFNFLLAIAYTQLFNLLCDKAYNDYGGRLPVHVRCLVDEAANIGEIPKMEKLISVIRSRGISCALIYQTASQIKTTYKDAADTIIGNMDTEIFLGGKEQSTRENLSKDLGQETIDTYTTGESRGQSPSYSLNYQKAGHALMSRDELAVMDGGKCIVQVRGVRPFFSDKYDITKHPLYPETADADPKNAFDLEAFLKTHFKLRKKDTYEVVEVDLSAETEEDDE